MRICHLGNYTKLESSYKSSSVQERTSSEAERGDIFVTLIQMTLDSFKLEKLPAEDISKLSDDLRNP
jgi:hypothetical protein